MCPGRYFPLRHDLGDAEDLGLSALDPAGQGPGRGRGVADRVERQQDLREPPAAPTISSLIE